jgi:hypothetical protein
MSARRWQVREDQMNTTYADELGKCLAERNNLRIHTEPSSGMLAVYSVAREMLWDANYNYLGLGDRLEAVLIGYVSDIDNAEHAFDVAEEELRALSVGA